MNEWYCMVGQQRYGPYTSEQMTQFVASGNVQPNTLVWNGSMTDWTPASQVLSFPNRVPASAAPGPVAGTQPVQYYTPAYQRGAYVPGYNRSHFTFPFVWMLVMLCVSQALGILSEVLTSAAAPGDRRQLMALGLVLLVVGLTTIGAVVGQIISWCHLVYRCWNAVNDQPDAQPPGKVVGFNFIPFVNIYWIWVAHVNLANILNREGARRGISSRVITAMPIIGIIVTFIHRLLAFTLGAIASGSLGISAPDPVVTIAINLLEPIGLALITVGLAQSASIASKIVEMRQAEAGGAAGYYAR